jgi:hypothetical protein
MTDFLNFFLLGRCFFYGRAFYVKSDKYVIIIIAVILAFNNTQVSFILSGYIYFQTHTQKNPTTTWKAFI